MDATSTDVTRAVVMKHVLSWRSWNCRDSYTESLQDKAPLWSCVSMGYMGRGLVDSGPAVTIHWARAKSWSHPPLCHVGQGRPKETCSSATNYPLFLTTSSILLVVLLLLLYDTISFTTIHLPAQFCIPPTACSMSHTTVDLSVAGMSSLLRTKLAVPPPFMGGHQAHPCNS